MISIIKVWYTCNNLLRGSFISCVLINRKLFDVCCCFSKKFCQNRQTGTSWSHKDKNPNKKSSWNREKMGSKTIKQLMNLVKLLLPHQKRNASNCRETIFQALSTCISVRIYLVCSAGVWSRHAKVREKERQKGYVKKIVKLQKIQEPHQNSCFTQTASRSSNGFQLLKRKGGATTFLFLNLSRI